MANAYKDVQSLPFKVPDSIVQIKVDPVTGQPYDGPGAILEAFKKDPGTNMDIHHEENTDAVPTERENEAGIY